MVKVTQKRRVRDSRRKPLWQVHRPLPQVAEEAEAQTA